MIEKIWKMIEDFTQKYTKKKMIEISIIVGVVGIIIVITAGTVFGNKDNAKNHLQNKDYKNTAKIITSNDIEKIKKESTTYEIEKKLENILSDVKGAGEVTVMITYLTGKEIIPAYDIKKNTSSTQEKDNGGGNRNIMQDNYESKIIYEDGQNNAKRPIIIKELNPQVKGVIIVADGASNISVRENLRKAVEIVLDIPIHKIQVLERK